MLDIEPPVLRAARLVDEMECPTLAYGLGFQGKTYRTGMFRALPDRELVTVVEGGRRKESAS